MKKKTNPWEHIKIPNQENNFSATLADKDNLLNFYWAKDSSGNLLFILHTTSAIIINQRIPKLNGIKVTVGSYGKKNELLLTLLAKEEQDIFYTLCIDLLQSTQNIHDEVYAVKNILKRLEKWQFFLKNSRKLIDKKKLKGLIGELLFLNKYLLKKYEVEEALNFWRAPLSSVQDFEFNNIALEVKTKASVNSIKISSYEQLFSELDYLFLYVATLNESTAKIAEAFNIFDLIDEIRQTIKLKDNMLVDMFENLLMLYGFIELEEFKEYYFLFVTDEFYLVSDDFPRIKHLPEGIEKLSFRINLDRCKEFIASDELLEKVGIKNG